jgi:glycosyltransferase involved in cell wall biosynthesis
MTVHHGGAERVVLELARRQRALGAAVSVVCVQQLGELLPLFEAAGVPVRMIETTPRPGVLRTAWRLAQLLREASGTVVHTHNSAPQVAAGLGEQLRHWRRPGTGLVHTEHGRLGDLRSTVLQLRRWTAREFDVIVAVSVDARAQLLKHGIRTRHGVDVVLNGVDLSRFAERPNRPVGATPRIVHVGRLDRIKGQDVLLAALPAVCDVVPGVQLTIVGDGPTRQLLEDQVTELGIRDAVVFAGAADDVRPFLADVDLFVLPSRSEGISLALLEAMATGLPVVATDVGGNREVITEATGALVPPEQPGRLAVAIIELLQHPELATNKGIAGRRVVEQRFALEATVQAYAALYARACATSAGRRLGSAA